MDHRTFQLPRVQALFQRHPDARAVLWGELGGMPAVDLLNILSQGRRNGVLLARAPDGAEFALALQDGQIHWGEPYDPRGTTDALIRLEQGSFAFVGARHLDLEGDGLPIHEVLLDALRRLDEETAPAGG